MKSCLIPFVFFALMNAYGQRVEVPVRTQSTRPAIEVSNIRGYFADPTWARIPKAKVTLQKRKGTEFADIESVESDQIGEFNFGKRPAGIYQLVASAKGFCEVTVLLKVSSNGWTGLRIAMPVGVTDTPSGYCDQNLKIEELNK